MELKYEGAFEVNKSQKEVFKYLNDPNTFAKTLPGFRKVSISENGSFKINLTLKTWPLIGEATVEGAFIELKEPSYTKISGKGTGTIGTLEYTLEFKITQSNSKSKVNWTFNGKVKGPAATVSERILNAIARNIIEEIANNIVKTLENINKNP